MNAVPLGLAVTRGQRTSLLTARIALMRGVRPSDLIHATSKSAPVAWARHELRWALKQLEPGYSNAQVGHITGGADPTTVLHSVGRVDERMKSDADYATEMRALLDEFLAPPEEVGPTAVPTAPILTALQLVLAGRLSDREARQTALALLDAVGVSHG